MFFEQLTTPGLGCYSYAIGCPLAGVMAVVDPRRDADIYLQIAEGDGMRITHIFETHIHADHVSGALELRAATGADIYVHEGAPVAYGAKKLRHGDEFRLGNALIHTLHTPGHTPNSVSFLVTDLSRSPAPQLILTGDLLFVGDIGRPDLPGAEILEEQTENLYNSLYGTLGPLPDYLEVYPSHGEGSLCGAGMSAKPHSTLGYERLANPMLQYPSFIDFKKVILSHLPMRPLSFSAIIAANLKGADVSASDHVNEDRPLTAAELSALQEAGVYLLDVRNAFEFAACHIPSSINVDFSDGPRLNWVGMVIPPGARIALITASEGEYMNLVVELRRIGYDSVAGWLKGGVGAWKEGGRATQGTPYMTAAELKARLAEPNPPILLDVRDPAEFNADHIDGAVNLTFDRIPDQTIYPPSSSAKAVIVCLSGFRAAIAASLLRAQGCDNISILRDGMESWHNIT